jgi:anti-anti-sigma regulatory factor
MAERRGALGFLADSSLGFDPDEVLVHEPGLLLEPAFQSALRDELEREMGPDESMAAPSAQAVSPACSALPLRVRPVTGEKGLVMEGCWPERGEASVHIAREGVPERPACTLSAGYTSGWLSGILDADVLVIETECAAQGADTCRFVAREVEAWLDRDDDAADEALCALPYGSLREIVAREVEETGAANDSNLEASAPVIHIWGPVMVIPFSGVDEALAAVDLVSHDPGASEVSVVVVDLSGAIIDDAFGAVALERIIESIESWGGEAILAGASPLSESVLEDLEHPPLMIQKDLEEAIAAAFRIADSQRRTL